MSSQRHADRAPLALNRGSRALGRHVWQYCEVDERLFDHLPYASLQRLKLSRALRIDDGALLCLAQILEAQRHDAIALRELDLGSPYITNASIPALSSIVRLAGLQSLTLWRERLRDELASPKLIVLSPQLHGDVPRLVDEPPLPPLPPPLPPPFFSGGELIEAASCTFTPRDALSTGPKRVQYGTVRSGRTCAGLSGRGRSSCCRRGVTCLGALSWALRSWRRSS